MGLFQMGSFVAASGTELPWKVECDALTDADWKWAALQIACNGPFSSVEGVPTGGLRLASLLLPFAETHRQVEPSGPLLIVDDVLTTGGSMERQRAGRDALGFVVFARGPLPPWVRALWTFTA
jgi:orotate phosphoribosyltransferase